MVFAELMKEAEVLLDHRQRIFEEQIRSLDPVFSLWQADEAEKNDLISGCWQLTSCLQRNHQLFASEQFLVVVPSTRIPTAIQTRGLLPNFDEADNLGVSGKWKNVQPEPQRPYLMLDPCARPIRVGWHQRYSRYWRRQIIDYGHVPMSLVEGITWLANRHRLAHSEIDFHCDYIILGTKGSPGRVIRILHGLSDHIRISITPWLFLSRKANRPQYLLTRKQGYHH